MKAAKLWPLAVVGALVVTVGANVAIFVLANDADKATVEPNYYEKAVAWDSTMAQERRNGDLGWRVRAEFAPDDRGALLRATLVDREGAPISGALLHVEAIHNLDADRRIESTLRDAGGGVYEAVLPLRHRGLWELRVRATKQGALFTESLRVDLAAVPTGR